MRSYTTIFTLAIVVLFISGCYDLFYSLHPGYTEDTLIYDEGLLGIWGEERGKGEDKRLEPSIMFKKGNGNKYLLELIDDSADEFTTDTMEASVFKVGENYFLDLYISKENIDKESYNPFVFIPVHVIMKIDWDDNNLVLSFLEENSLYENEITDEPSDDTAYNILSNSYGNGMLTTTSTESVQAFLRKYWNNEENFDTLDFKRYISNEEGD